MEETKIQATVRGQSLQIYRQPPVVSGTIDYLEIAFTFSPEWEGMVKWAHIAQGDKTYDIRLKMDCIRKSDHLNLRPGTWKLWVHGMRVVDGEPVERITTTTASLSIIACSSLQNDGPLPKLPFSAAEKMDAMAQEALQQSENAWKEAKKTGLFAEQASQAAEASGKAEKIAVAAANSATEAAAAAKELTQTAQTAAEHASASRESTQQHVQQTEQNSKKAAEAEAAAANSARQAAEAEQAAKSAQSKTEQAEATVLHAVSDEIQAHDKTAAAHGSLFEKKADRRYSDQSYSNAIVKHVGGEVVCPELVSPLPHEVLCHVRSKNIVPLRMGVTETINGITWTIQADGTIVADGTATEMSQFRFTDGILLRQPLLLQNAAIPVCWYAYPGDRTVYVQVAGNEPNGSELYFDLIVNSANGTFSGGRPLYKGTKINQIFARIKRGTTVNHFTFKLQLEYGSSTENITQYTPYIPDLTAIKVFRYGRNLVDDAVEESQYQIIEDKTYVRELPPLPNADVTIRAEVAKKLPDTYFYIQEYDVELGKWVGVMFKNSNPDNRGYIVTPNTLWKNLIFTAESDKKYRFFVYLTNTFQNIQKIQISVAPTERVFDYVQPQTLSPLADGAVPGMTSLAPDMTIYADVPGVCLDVVYHLDANLAMQQMLERITALENKAEPLQ